MIPYPAAQRLRFQHEITYLIVVVGSSEYNSPSRRAWLLGMMTHAAWFLNKPTVMIYGGGHYGRFLPLKSSRTITSKT